MENSLQRNQIKLRKVELVAEGSITRILTFLNINNKYKIKQDYKKTSLFDRNQFSSMTINSRASAFPSLRNIVRHKYNDMLLGNATVSLNKISSLPVFEVPKERSKLSERESKINGSHSGRVSRINHLATNFRSKRSKRKIKSNLCIYGNAKPINMPEHFKTEPSFYKQSEPYNFNENHVIIDVLDLHNRNVVIQPISVRNKGFEEEKSHNNFTNAKYVPKLKLDMITPAIKRKIKNRQKEISSSDSLRG